jgi:hypothetical protein
MFKHREEANLKLRKDAMTDMIEKKRYTSLSQNKTASLIIQPSEITPDKQDYYNKLSQVRYN